LEPSSDKVSHKLYLEFRYASSFATFLFVDKIYNNYFLKKKKKKKNIYLII